MKLVHTAYRVGDIERSVAFYETIGFREYIRLPLRDASMQDIGVNVFMALPDDGPRLELTHVFGVDRYDIGTGYNHIGVTVDDLDATLERLAAHGIEPEGPPFEPVENGARICFFPDPDGYRVELLENLEL